MPVRGFSLAVDEVLWTLVLFVRVSLGGGRRSVKKTRNSPDISPEAIPHTTRGRRKTCGLSYSHPPGHKGFRGLWRMVIYYPYWPIIVPTEPGLMSWEKNNTQWNTSQYWGNKKLIATWRFYLQACSSSWPGWKRLKLKKGGETVGFSIIWFLWTLLWSAAGSAVDGLPSVLNIFERSFLSLSLFRIFGLRRKPLFHNCPWFIFIFFSFKSSQYLSKVSEVLRSKILEKRKKKLCEYSLWHRLTWRTKIVPIHIWRKCILVVSRILKYLAD